MAQFARQTVEKLSCLRHGGETCFLKVGSLEIATTHERLADLYLRLGRPAEEKQERQFADYLRAHPVDAQHGIQVLDSATTVSHPVAQP